MTFFFPLTFFEKQLAFQGMNNPWKSLPRGTKATFFSFQRELLFKKKKNTPERNEMPL